MDYEHELPTKPIKITKQMEELHETFNEEVTKIYWTASRFMNHNINYFSRTT